MAWEGAGASGDRVGAGRAGRSEDPGKLARSTTGIPVVGVLDGFRALAVLAIVVHHLNGVSGLHARLPELAVVEMISSAMPRMIDILFIVSGFVLFMPTIARGGVFGSVWTYAARRAARIAPTYLLTLAVVLGLLLLYPPLSGAPRPTPLEVGVHLVFMQSPARSIDPSFPIGFGLDGALWTISTLVCFYILLPVIARPYLRHPLLWLGIALATTIVWRELIGDTILAVDVTGGGVGATAQLPYWTFHLALGMTAAWAYHRLHERGLAASLARWAPLVQLLAVAGLVLVLYFGNRIESSGNMLVEVREASRQLWLALSFPALLTALILATALAPRRTRLGLDSTPARKLGDSSYGVYMIHLPIVYVIFGGALLAADGSATTVTAWLAAVIVPSTLFGWLAFRYLEIPVRARTRAWAYRREPPSAVAAPEAPATTPATAATAAAAAIPAATTVSATKGSPAAPPPP